MNWQTLIRGEAALHKGAEIDRCIPDGFRHRFAIYSVRILGWEKNLQSMNGGFMTYDVRYRVRDVEAANDEHFKSGKPAPIFGEYATLDEALAAIEPYRINDEFF